MLCGLIAFAVYYIYHKETDTRENSNNVVVENKTSDVTNIRLGITGVDKLNPIVSKNQGVQDIIAKLVYEPLLNVTEDYKLENRTCNRMVKG